MKIVAYSVGVIFLFALLFLFIAMRGSATNKPIEAYWKIIDQNNNPVSDVEVNASISYWGWLVAPGLYPSRRALLLTSDSEGRFSIKGTSGLSLGFGDSQGGKQFEKSNYTFKWAKGLGESDHLNKSLTGGSSYKDPIIIHAFNVKNRSPNLMIGNKILSMVPDGRNYEFVMEEGKFTDQHKKASIFFSFHIPAPQINQKDKPEWTVKMFVRDEGGLIESNDVLMFDAPETGYQDDWVLKHEKNSEDWSSQTKREFYFKAQNGRMHGRVSVKFFPFFGIEGNSAARIKYWVNLDGSRDLYSERVP